MFHRLHFGNEFGIAICTCVFLSKRMDSKTLQGEIISMWEQRTDNRDVDNILSKKFKPFSSHILDIYFEKLSFTSTFGQTC